MPHNSAEVFEYPLGLKYALMFAGQMMSQHFGRSAESPAGDFDRIDTVVLPVSVMSQDVSTRCPRQRTRLAWGTHGVVDLCHVEFMRVDGTGDTFVSHLIFHPVMEDLLGNGVQTRHDPRGFPANQCLHR